MAVPTLSEMLNTEFTHTWYEIRAQAIDNILDATPITALLKAKGCFKTQSGGRYIERTVAYGKKTAGSFKKGTVLPVTEEELETVGLWPWAYLYVPITRTFVDDQQNAGPSKIKDYVATRMVAARNAVIEKIEHVFMATAVHDGGTDPLSLFDYAPDTSVTDYFSSASYTYGGIGRNNTWWQHKDFTAAAGASSANQIGIKAGPYALTLLEDMTNAYNYAGAQMSYPDIILTTQAIFEIYETFAVAKEQIIRDETTRLADLGYEVLRFKGKPLTWSEHMTASQMLMLNSQFFDVVYDPIAWFDLTSWERPERQLEQVAYIICAMQNVGCQPRRNARIKWSA